MDGGTVYQCRITAITGGGPEKSLGVNIEITDAPGFESILREQYVPVDPVPGRIPTSVWLLLVAAIMLILFSLITGKC